MALLIRLDMDNASAVVEEMLDALSSVEQGAQKAASRAINKTLKNAARLTARMVAGEFRVTQSEVLAQVDVRKATYARPDGELVFSGRGSLPLVRYVVGSTEPVPTMPGYYRTPKAQRHRGVKVRVKKTGRASVLTSAFLARMDSGHVGVFERVDEGWDSKIRELYSISYLTWLQNDLVADELEERVAERFAHHMEHEARFVLQQAGLR
ncbi:phage tail protein [Pseudodesulfovibrio pelocollis]|uniref:phage tail protein n=1 Tax=Pseudodesulfovibrio pelocollis TaxID=3051432 RepID=UPI00255AC9DC|nr:phage tail protein [Pseudodesulfovibrio sp. SB368]